MCGIVGYIGTRDVLPILLNGLKRQEYRGYDSAGIAFISQGEIIIQKKKGKVSALEESLNGTPAQARVGIGHTRWATHGEPSDCNAHPHRSNSGQLAMVHNGIIENYASLKSELLSKGYTFSSETDSEVLLNFIEDIQVNTGVSLEEAVRIALKRVHGAYVILILSAEAPHQIIAARKGSPLVIGIGKGEHFLGSDASPMLEYTREVVYVNDYEMAIVQADELVLKNLGNERQNPYISTLDMELAAIEKAGYEHFMLKEIFEQQHTIYDCLRGRLHAESHKIIMKGVDEHLDKFLSAKRMVIIACGTSWHAALVAEYILEALCRIPVEVEYASEFRYRNPVVDAGDIVIAVSQSGETADTLVAIEQAKEKGAFIFGIVNVVGSSIARASHAGAYTHAGMEIGVASTKAFTAQLAVFYLLGLRLGMAKNTVDALAYAPVFGALENISDVVKETLQLQDKLIEVAKKYQDATDMIYLGRGLNFPIALEGALKLKEISYIHAEGYPAAEMKHGPIALVDEHLPVIFLATKDEFYEKIVSNIQEVKARKGRVIAVATQGDSNMQHIADDVIYVPEIPPFLSPLINVIPLQLLSYYLGVLRGSDVDKPRNLAKSVTVE